MCFYYFNHLIVRNFPPPLISKNKFNENFEKTLAMILDLDPNGIILVSNTYPVCKSHLIRIKNIFGIEKIRRIRWFPKFKDSKDNNNPDAFRFQGEIERASKNTPIQGSNGDVIKLALIKVQEAINKNNYPVTILLSVYDEIQTECEASFADEWKGILDSIMIEAAKEVIKETPVVVDCKISDYWEK